VQLIDHSVELASGPKLKESTQDSSVLARALYSFDPLDDANRVFRQIAQMRFVSLSMLIPSQMGLAL